MHCSGLPFSDSAIHCCWWCLLCCCYSCCCCCCTGDYWAWLLYSVTILDLLGYAVLLLHCFFLARVGPPSSRRLRAYSNFDGQGKRGYVTVAVSLKQKFSYLSMAFGCSPCTYFYFDPPNRPSVYSTLHDWLSGISCHCVLSPLHLQLSYSKAKTAAFPPSQFLASGKGTRDIRRVHCKNGHITRAMPFRLLLCVCILHCKRLTMVDFRQCQTVEINTPK